MPGKFGERIRQILYAERMLICACAKQKHKYTWDEGEMCKWNSLQLYSHITITTFTINHYIRLLLGGVTSVMRKKAGIVRLDGRGKFIWMHAFRLIEIDERWRFFSGANRNNGKCMGNVFCGTKGDTSDWEKESECAYRLSQSYTFLLQLVPGTWSPVQMPLSFLNLEIGKKKKKKCDVYLFDSNVSIVAHWWVCYRKTTLKRTSTVQQIDNSG